eukprot:CAMPEP_0202048890 /NCGR_PEP_ID=MMETSP0963-20130614/3021_1 /ASSEMBLY_ACC=CAM_ASM_000494 /TAXON_ID=4773 /ORGANISM="Schizochytrium aggregatum, Strain ATCC28209" /LENGTH=706 /DNA_ID=CAMNT_0048613853 /DNA_START=1 /DNA_END=2121 /DNA_ORIENTATION=+
MVDDREARFAHLLKPIRELADNWDIDVAGDLEEYLEELDGIVINFEDGDVNLNFAEAALLIQGSTMVYSKKVEFLHRLVYSVLDQLCGDGREETRARPSEEPAELARITEAKERFLLLDDEIMVDKNLEFKDTSLETTQGLRERVPLALMADRSGMADPTRVFKMMSCDVDASGRFLLQSFATDSQRREPGLLDEDTEGHLDGDRDSDDDGIGFGTDDEGHNLDLLSDDGRQEHGDDQRDGHAGTPGSAGEGPGELGGGEADDWFDTGGEGASSEDEADEEEDDPWERLDPHIEIGPGDTAPLKVAKTWRTPRSLVKSANKEAHARSGDMIFTNLLVSVAMMPSLANKLSTREGVVLYPELRGYAAERRRQVRKAAATARRLGTRRAAAQVDEADDIDVEDEEDRVAQFMLQAAQAGSAQDDLDDSNSDVDDFYHGDADEGASLFGGDDEDEDASPRMGHPQRLDLSSAAFDNAPESYVDMVKSHLQRYLANANQWASESRLHARVRRWEEKIEPFLVEQTARPAFDIHNYGGRILSGFASTVSSGSKDVSGSGSLLSFDELSARIGELGLNKQSQSSEDSSEDEADSDSEHVAPEATTSTPGASALDQFEVCRLFLASLQLANNGNVELVHESNNSELRIRLLDNVLANKKLEGYLAPSAAQVQPDAPAEEQEDSLAVEKRRAKRQRKVRSGSTARQDVENIAVN